MLYYVYVTVDLGMCFSQERIFLLDAIPLRTDICFLLITHERRHGIIELYVQRQIHRRKRHSGLGKTS